MTTTLLIITVTVLVIGILLYLYNRSNSQQQTQSQNQQNPPPPAPAPTPQPAQTTSTASTSFGLGKFISGFFKFAAGLALFAVAVTALFLAGIKIKNLIDSATNPVKQHVVILEPHITTPLNLGARLHWDYQVPFPVRVEFLNADGEKILVNAEGRLVYEVVDTPNHIHDIDGYEDDVKYLLFSSNQRGSFMVKVW